MSNNQICLTKEYASKEFSPFDLQFNVDLISDNFTLYDLFLMIHNAEQNMPGIAATMGMSSFDDFWQQINLDSDDDRSENIKYLQLSWFPGYDIITTKKTGKPTDQGEIKGLSSLIDQNVNRWDDPKRAYMSGLMDVVGIGPGCPSRNLDFHECGDDCDTKTSYGVGLTSVNNLGHLPIRVSTKVNFYPPHVESDRDFKPTGFELNIQPTLWCLATSIFWELTFFGYTPTQISDELQKLKDQMNDIKEQFDKNSTPDGSKNNGD